IPSDPEPVDAVDTYSQRSYVEAHGNIQTETKKEDEWQSADAVEELQQYLGGYGRYQVLIYFFLSLVYMRGGWHVWVPIYQSWTPSFHCSASPGLSLDESVPTSVDDDGVMVFAECEQYVNLSVSNATEPCHNGWTYLWNSSYTSIVSWMDLVCDHAYQAELTTTMYMVGTATGTIFLTPLADRFGSKIVMLVCLWVQAVLGTVLIWASNIIAFCILKFLIGMTNITIALTTYVLMTESFDANHREIPTIALQFFWALGIISMALLGYLVPAWQDLELVIALPINILSLSFIFIIPESLPWLLSKGKIKEAEEVINKFIRFNRLSPVPDLHNKLAKFELKNEAKDSNSNSSSDDEVKGDLENPSALSLFKTPKLRIISIIMFYLFLVNSLAYFGIMYSTPQLAGDRFVNLCLLGVVEIPAYILCLLANRVIGRRYSISIFLFICAVCNLAVLFIPEETADGTNLHHLKTALVIIGKFGITGSYSAIYLYATEVYPTVIRNQAVGASSFFENIGGIAAPNMVYVESSLANLPLGIFGGMTIVGCILVLLLPETHNQPMPQTIDEIEKRVENRQRSRLFPCFGN
ncbi:solute carrier family 22 member 4, partial [Plakobranchus ocellatus]